MTKENIHEIDHDLLLKSVYQLAETTEYDENHSQQVKRISLEMFDQLQSIHHLSQKDRNHLEYASVLHDIGWIEGWKGHHKISLQIILNTKLLPFSSKERLIIGSIARYHRGSLPSNDHDHFKALSKKEKEKVRILAAILRLADGMDHAHQSNLNHTIINITPNKIIIKCITNADLLEDKHVAQEKSDLFKQVFNDRDLLLVWKS